MGFGLVQTFGIALVRSILPPGQPARGDTSEQRNAIAVGMAERSLADGQLALAVDQLLLLEDRGALIAAEWLRDATARLAADRAIGMVVAQAFDRLATAP